MINRRPLPISFSPPSSPASEILSIPYIRRYDLHRSSSFLRRMNRLKLIPTLTLSEVLKFRVEKGLATVAVHPSPVIRALHFQTPSQLVSSTRPSSQTSESNSVPSGLKVKVYPFRRSLPGETSMVK